MALKDYPHPSVTADVVAFTLARDDLQVLLIRRKNPPFEGMWAIPGGFVGVGEPLQEAALRELEEETGLRDLSLEQLHTFGDPDRDPRGHVITVAYSTVMPPTCSVRTHAGDDAAQACWWSAHDPPALAFDHADILACAVGRLRAELPRVAARFRLLPGAFTLAELQAVYEIILGEKVDKRELRRQMLKASPVEQIGERRSDEGLPTRLYRFREDAKASLKARGPPA